MSKRKIIYNPELSIAENARHNKLSESSIRRYIRKNGIDRKGDNAIIIQREILSMKKANDSLTVSQISTELNLAVNTVKKYLNIEKTTSNIDSEKLSVFDTSKRKFIISSVSEFQEEILNNILRLYVKAWQYHCDFTYSKGYFYKRIPQPLLKFDKYPQLPDVKPLSEAKNLEDNSLESVVVDLPFIIRNNKGGQSFNDNIMSNRFNYFESPTELYQTNDDIISLAYSKLKKNGILVMKTMDIVFAGRQHWVSHYVIQTSTAMGFELLDKFILISKTRLLRADHCRQIHARKYHSYFLVFRKKQV